VGNFDSRQFVVFYVVNWTDSKTSLDGAKCKFNFDIVVGVLWLW